jgi:hypothetical protein
VGYDSSEVKVNHCRIGRNALVLFVVALLGALSALAQEKSDTGTVPVRMTVTLSVVGDRRMPDVKIEDVSVQQRRNRLQVTGWTPARGDRAGLDLFILIDDASDTSLGSQLNELRTFINAQAPSTNVGVGYMRNATVQIVQNFTTDHAAAASSVRLPLGNTGSFGSPYLSVIDLMNRWPEHPNRRVIVMITDGIDRARGGPRSRGLGTFPDVNRASDVGQRTGTIINTIYAPGVGFRTRNFWEATNGQNGIAKLSDETGGESFFLGLQSAVSFRPYLDSIQTSLSNQFILEFRAVPGRRAGLQSVSLGTEVAGVELVSADGVWVPAAGR